MSFETSRHAIARDYAIAFSRARHAEGQTSFQRHKRVIGTRSRNRRKDLESSRRHMWRRLFSPTGTAAPDYRKARPIKGYPPKATGSVLRGLLFVTYFSSKSDAKKALAIRNKR